MIKAGIRPGQFSPTDRPVMDSRYITYRNDLSEDAQRAMDSKEITRDYPKDRQYNPFGRPDPFVGIKIRPQLATGLDAKP